MPVPSFERKKKQDLLILISLLVFELEECEGRKGIWNKINPGKVKKMTLRCFFGVYLS